MANRRHGFNYWWKRLLIAVYVVIFVIVVASSFTDDDPGNDDPGGLLFVGLVFALVLAMVIGRILRNRTTDVLESNRVAQTGKDPVLFLRPFSQDDDVVSHSFNGLSPQSWGMLLRPAQMVRSVTNLHRFTFGKLLQRACRDVGPVIGIGEPGEIVPSGGIVTEYAGDDWESRVRELMKRSQLVVLRAGTSQGLMQEIGLAIDLVPPQQLLIFVGSGQERRNLIVALGGWYITNGVKRERFYSEFRSHANDLFLCPLPEVLGNHKLIRFEDDWRPVLVSRRTRSAKPNTAERVALWMDLATDGRPGTGNVPTAPANETETATPRSTTDDQALKIIVRCPSPCGTKLRAPHSVTIRCASCGRKLRT